MEANIDKDFVYKCCDLVKKVSGYYTNGYITYMDLLSHAHKTCVWLYKVSRTTTDKMIQRVIDVALDKYKNAVSQPNLRYNLNF